MGDGYISFYEGGYSSLSPENGNYVGYRLNAGQLASTTSPQTANQLSETIARIKEGVQNVEVSLVSPEVAEGTPRQQFKEMYALMKLTGVKPSVHAPVIDPAGIIEQRYGGENARQDVERKFMDVLEKAHELDPKGNIPVVFHSSNAGTGSEYRPGDEKRGEERFKIVADAIINQETGQIQSVKEKRVYYPDRPDTLRPGEDIEKQGKTFTTDEMIRSSNQSDWDNKIRETAMLQKEVEENIKRTVEIRGMGSNLPEIESEASQFLSRSDIFLRDAELSFRSIFDKSYEYGSENQKKELKKLTTKWQEEQRKILAAMKEKKKDPVEILGLQNQVLGNRLRDLRECIEDGKENIPQINMRAQDFVQKKAAKTFGNVAWNAYQKWKDNTPVLAIENLYPGMAFAKAEDLTELIKKSKENFIQNAKKSGMSESEAKSKANKFIGATWDVGHLNIMKKQGFTDKDIIEQTKKITPLVKHVHLTDNFGFGDSHLAMGMGNVPIKEILKKLEENGEFAKMRKVIEAGGLVNPNMGLKMSPFRATIGAFGSQIQGGPSPVYWNQAESVQGNYFAFPMAYMPEKHFSIYGSGFSTLPEELGGQIPGTQSRFSGTPNS